MITRERAYQLRDMIRKASASLDDKDASTAPELYARLTGDGGLIKAGTRVNWRGTVYRAAVDLWDNEQSTPETAPTLWAAIKYRDGIRIIPEVITVTEAFAKDELGWWGDVVYKSLIDENVYTPTQYPPGWEAQSDG